MVSIPVGLRKPATGAILLVLTATLSGCLFDGDFESVTAPSWAPGFEWEWDVETASVYESSQGSGSSQNSESAHFSVEGTAELENGTTAYIISQQQGMGQLYGNERLQLVSQDLETLATTWDEVECGPDILWRESSYYGSGMLPQLRFPLNAGATWTDDWDGMEWDVEVKSKADVETPAGSFDAIEIRYEAKDPSTQNEWMFMYGGMDSFELNMTAWYAPEARQIVKVEGENTWNEVIEEETVKLSNTMLMELSSYSLSAEDGLQLDDVKIAPDPRNAPRMPPLEIVADQDLPINSAEDDTNVTFSLELQDHARIMVESRSEPSPEPVLPSAHDALGAAGPRSSSESPSPSSPPQSYPAADYEYPEDWNEDELHWALHERSHGIYGTSASALATGKGAEFTVELPSYGNFQVTVTDSPREEPMHGDEDMVMYSSSSGSYCSGPSQQSYSFNKWQSVRVYFEDHYTVKQDTGLPEEHHVDSFIAPDAPAILYAFYDVGGSPLNLDDADLVLVDPKGDRQVLRENDALEIDQEGEWEIVWDVHGIGGLVADGHSVEIDLIVYPR